MQDALIGHTGFVGSNLLEQRNFDLHFNSKNFRDMSASNFDAVVCAGVSAVKWKANKEPDQDWQNVSQLQEVLATTTARHFVLISTIDVYPVIAGKDESYNCSEESNHSYGTHRLRFEQFCQSHFPQCTVIRLPALFGPGIRKNVIFDLLNNNCLEMINPDCSFQYYPLNRLWSDIAKTIDLGLPLVNLFTEPIQTSSILNRFFPESEVGQKAGPEVHYDLHTMHAAHWGNAGRYIMDSDEVLTQLESFVKTYERSES